jgi:hypothetical protein
VIWGHQGEAGEIQAVLPRSAENRAVLMKEIQPQWFRKEWQPLKNRDDPGGRNLT